MSGAWLRLWFATVALLGTCAPVDAQYHEATPAEQAFASLEQQYVPPSTTVRQAAYADLPTSRIPAPLPPPSPAQVLAAPTVIPPANQPSLYPPPQGAAEIIGPPPCDNWCIPPQAPCRTSSWNAEIDLIPSDTLITDGQFGRWDDNSAGALRLVLGYEDPEGIGIRARIWGLSEDASTPADDVELNMGTFDLDLYKRLFFDHAEIAVGGGGASGALEFKLSDDTHSRFEGGGATLFLDGYYTLQEYEKSEIGAVARARYTLLMGDWRDTTGGIVVPRTDNDTMSIAELAWGLEYRRRFGPAEDHNWFLGVLLEYQRWQSDWMSNLAGTSIGVSGINIYTGLNW